MRELLIAKLAGFINDADGYGIPRYFDCVEEDHIIDADDLNTMTDQELLEIFEATVGFGG